MKLLMAGGVWLNVKAIKLYEVEEVSYIATTKAKALKALGPGATAVGVGGTPSWTLAAEATALSLVSGLLAGVAAKQAMEQLGKLQIGTEYLLRELGTFFELSDITNIKLPYPASWSATVNGKKFVHSSDDFVITNSEHGEISVRWSSVSAMG